MKTEQKILGVNTFFESVNFKDFHEHSFNTPISYMDYDAVLIDSSFLSYEYKEDYPSTFKGKRIISKEDSHKMVSDFDTVREQIIEILKQGKNVFVIMGRNENCYVYTGKTEYSGTGKNARGTDIVNEFNVLSFLPIDIEPTFVTGENFTISCQNPYANFFQQTKDLSYYNSYFKSTVSTTLLSIPNSDKAVSAVFEYYSGKIILLPNIYSEDEFENEKEWNEQAEKYLTALYELNRNLLSKANEYVLPTWSEEIKILNEEETENKILDDERKLEKLQNKILKQKEQLCKIQKYKILLTASGPVLEEIVKDVLISLGFTLKQTQKGRSDIIAEYNNINIVAEIKGVSKSAAEKHAAQLEKWVAEFIEENDKIPKPLLIINGFCDTPIDERTEDIFPNQMLKYCNSREHALITTTQLLCLFIEITQNPECANERLSELLSCVGVYQRYKDTNAYLFKTKNMDAE